jgi:hypothetical protein
VDQRAVAVHPSINQSSQVFGGECLANFVLSFGWLLNRCDW